MIEQNFLMCLEKCLKRKVLICFSKTSVFYFGQFNSHNEQEFHLYCFVSLLIEDNCLPRIAKSCGAVKHCIQTVWEHQQLPPDGDDVCKICLDMVKQARDQLESNETQVN